MQNKKVCITATSIEDLTSQRGFIASLTDFKIEISFLVPENLKDFEHRDSKIYFIEDLAKNIPYYLEFNCNNREHYLSFLFYEGLKKINNLVNFDAIIFLSDISTATVSIQGKKALGEFLNTNIVINKESFSAETPENFESCQRSKAIEEFDVNNADVQLSQIKELTDLFSVNNSHFTRYKDLTEVPKLSVIIPFYNTGKFLEEALFSLENNNYPNMEIIIINDGSSDADSLEVLSKLEKTEKYVILHQENKGVGSARNLGLSNVSGDYVLFFDSDDTISQDYIEKSINCLLNNPNYSYVNTHHNMVSEDEKHLLHYQIVYSDHINTILTGDFLFPGIFKKSAIQNFRFDESLKRHEDWDFYITLAKNNHKGLVIPEFLYNYRKRWNSLMNTFSNNDRGEYREYLYKKHREFFDENGVNITEIKSESLNIDDILKTESFKGKIQDFIAENKDKKVCFYGAGQIAHKILELYDLSKLDILGFIDGNPNKKGQKIGNYPIFSPDELEFLAPDILALTVLQKQFVIPYLEGLKARKGWKFRIIHDLG